MNNADHKIFKTFEEFEREELRAMEMMGASVADMIDTNFAEELDFDAGSVRRSSRVGAGDEEE